MEQRFENPPDPMEFDNNSEAEDSDGALQIVETAPRVRRKAPSTVLDEHAKELIASLEKDIEEKLETQALKAKLSAQNVKNILKQVVTNEHVIALLRHAENPDENDEPATVFEPKITRAKSKQLNTAPPPVLPWASPPRTPSEVHVLLNEELQEDSSGDEYVPEDDVDPKSVDTVLDLSAETKEGEDDEEEEEADEEEEEGGKGDEDEAANIALRTRSKLCLTDTHLETIEEAFIPPDITTDMYDVECEGMDDLWKEFLKDTYTQPVVEVDKQTEDDEHDPTYNILADEEIDKVFAVDKEELRADRAVTVSKKELNHLVAELFEYQDIYESNQRRDSGKNDISTSPSAHDKQSAPTQIDPDDVEQFQSSLLQQQLRQHVQLLTQNYLLTYQHPELYEMAGKVKNCLLELKAGSEGKTSSAFQVANLDPALKLVEDWETLLASETKEVKDYKRHVSRVIAESIQARTSGTQYIVTFPKLLMETISKSKVFIYPQLLPRIPFKSPNALRKMRYFFTNSEDNLIAIYFEMLHPILEEEKANNTCRNVSVRHMVRHIQSVVMTHISVKTIDRHYHALKDPDSEDNPIRYYLEYKTAPPTIHHIIPFDASCILPPRKVSADVLPYHWRQYIHGDPKSDTNGNSETVGIAPVIKAKPPVKASKKSSQVNWNSLFKIKQPESPTNNRSLPLRTPLNSCKKRRRNFLKEATRNRLQKYNIQVTPPKYNIEITPPQYNIQLSHPTQITVTLQLDKNLDMLPDMPSLGTPVKKTPEQPQAVSSTTEKPTEVKVEKPQLSFENIAQFDIQIFEPGSCSKSGASDGQKSGDSPLAQRDNPDDINDLMIASSTIKNVAKKEPSGAEKKKAKIRKEFIANLAMATPDDPRTKDQRDEELATAYLEKLQDTLSDEDFTRLMCILIHCEERKNDFPAIYRDVESVLVPKYRDLADQFLLFLTDMQAHSIGKLMTYFAMKDMERFVRKLQIYFKDQPAQLKKVLKAMSDMAELTGVDAESRRNSVLGLFKGNKALTDSFLQIFSSEKPPDFLSEGPCEVVNLNKELTRAADEEIYETIVMPEMEDPYGGATCICPCHDVEDQQFKLRQQHCKRCGLKFIHGKMFVQTGKSLRPAVVTFLTNPEKDHMKRLSATQRKRSDSSPNKQISPNKEKDSGQAPDENRNSNDSDDDCDGTKKKSKARRKRKLPKDMAKDSSKAKVREKSKCDSPPKPAKSSPKKTAKKRTPPKKPVVEEVLETESEVKPGATAGQQKRLACDDGAEAEIEYSEPAEFVMLKVSSDHSGESESAEFDESSQDTTNSDSDGSSTSVNLSPSHQSASDNITWSREEDKIILQTFQKHSDHDVTFQRIAQVLHNRSVAEIKHRFHKLMSLLQEMSSSSSPS